MLKNLRRFPLVAVLVLAAAVSACDGDDPSDPDDDDDNPDGTTTVTFTYDPAQAQGDPEITAIAVPGEFTTVPGVWSPTDPAFQMEEQDDGTWALTVELAPGEYEYKYHFNGDTWSPDMCNDAVFGDANGDVSPQQDGCNVNDNGNAIITVVSDDD